MAITARECLPKLSELKTKVEDEYARQKAASNQDDAELEAGNHDQAWVAHKDKRQHQYQKNTKCFKCGKSGHWARECKTKNPAQNTRTGFVAAALGVNIKAKNWIMDTGATNHMVSDIKMMKQSRPADESVLVASGDVMKAAQIGLAIIKNQCDGDIEMKEALYVPGLKMNLMSVKRATDAGFKAIFEKGQATVVDQTGKVIIIAKQINGLWQVRESESETGHKFCAMTNKAEPNLELWHRRLGHLHHGAIIKMSKNEFVKGMENIVPNYNAQCEVCIRNKIVEEPYPKEANNRATEILGRIHSDVCGPLPTVATGGEKYFVTFIDEKSRYLKVFAIKSRDEIGDVFETYKSFVEKQTGHRIKCMRTDNAAEYKGGKFAAIIKSCGIKHELTVPGSPAQNGMAERMNLTMINQVKCMLQEADLPYELWAEAVQTACYLRNRSATRTIRGMTPFELFWGIKPNLNHLRVFGCRAIAINKIMRRRKLDARGRVCRLVGYSSHYKGYRLLDTVTRKIFVSRTVKFLDEEAVVDGKVHFNWSTPHHEGQQEQQQPRRNPSRACKDVRPIPNLHANMEKKEAAKLKRDAVVVKRQAEQQAVDDGDSDSESDQDHKDDPPGQPIKWSEEAQDTPATFKDAVNSKWNKFW